MTKPCFPLLLPPWVCSRPSPYAASAWQWVLTSLAYPGHSVPGNSATPEPPVHSSHPQDAVQAASHFLLSACCPNRGAHMGTPRGGGHGGVGSVGGQEAPTAAD